MSNDYVESSLVIGHWSFGHSRSAYMLTRRQILQSASCGFGYLAFAGLASQAAADESPLAAKSPHFTPKAKRVIFLFMQGAPSHVDTFDYKPELIASDGKQIGGRAILAPQWKFKQHGKSGLWISELFPSVAQHADDLCLVNSMHIDNPA